VIIWVVGWTHFSPAQHKKKERKGMVVGPSDGPS